MMIRIMWCIILGAALCVRNKHMLGNIIITHTHTHSNTKKKQFGKRTGMWGRESTRTTWKTSSSVKLVTPKKKSTSTTQSQNEDDVVVSREPSIFQGPDVLEPLVGKCFQLMENQYEYSVCPFRNVTQAETHGTRSLYILGIWDRYEIKSSTDTVPMLFYDNGTSCGHTTHRKNPKDTSRKQRRRTTLDEEEDPDAALTAWMNRSSATSKVDEDDDDEEEEDDEKRLQRDIEKLATSSSFLYRLLAAIPPVVASAFIRDLSKTLAFSGLPALFVACVGPSLLQYYSSRACMRSLGTDRTRYSWHFSHSFYVYFMWIFSAAVSVIIVMQLIDTLHSN